ncbi:hypothetical protein FEM48_Zijuj04G0142300 [Ziziphus jujuba var. spinosa]|uniref:Heavy metal-associated isoprenylated plant protein 16-like n=1 Tax=Ziziphus jujuba var. spinosa TaxID=714518 RepID=A0A978VKC6_ZIZJJ|nr:hypothetical protein FEM48_Zijuj04G0142300 [Ziziphus jujuba var. spinosa]
MKQKVVIKVSLNDQKSRTKAIKTAVGVDGVIQAALQTEKNQIEVTGNDLDVVLLTTLLRKSLKYAEVVSVSVVEDKKEEKKDEKKDDPPKLVWTPYAGGVPLNVIYDPHHNPYQYQYQQDPSCSIM